MGIIKSISIFGGQEIIQCKFPDLLSKLNIFMLNGSNITSQNDIENFFNFKMSEHKLSKIHESPLGFDNEFDYPEMINISAYLFDEVVLYSPKKQAGDFWFDLISLNYLYLNDYFKACIIIFSTEFRKTFKLEFQQLITMLIDRSLKICGFPSFVIFDEID